MVRMRKEWPDEGDLVVGTVHKVLNYGAFGSLEEYDGKEAFIHISEVSSGWVKNIRDYVRENQKIVARVLRVNPKKGHVDVSLKRISEIGTACAITAWRRSPRCRLRFRAVTASVAKLRAARFVIWPAAPNTRSV